QEPALLFHQLLPDPIVEAPTRAGHAQSHSTTVLRMGGPGNVALPLQCRDHAAGGALVEIELRSELVQSAGPASEQGLDRIALRHRDVVAADRVPVPELVDTNQLRERRVQILRVLLE